MEPEAPEHQGAVTDVDIENGVRPAGSRTFRWLAAAGIVGTYLLIVLGGVVRITGSGMGCGDDWPLCNGRLIPPLDLPTMIEYGHRLAAAAVAILVVGLAVHAWLPGRGRRWRSARRLAAVALALLVLQVLLGAVTVWLELPPASVILHLGTAMALLATLVIVGCHAFGRGTGPAPRSGPEPGSGRAVRGVDRAAVASWVAAGLAFVTVLAGALVANLGAATACRGFPLCDGALFPAGPWRVQLHWGHRMLAYLLILGTAFLPALAAARRPGDRAAGLLSWAAVALALTQLCIAGVMVLANLDPLFRALHVAAGAALFSALVAHAWVFSHPVVAAGEVRAPTEAAPRPAQAEWAARQPRRRGVGSPTAR